MRVLPPNNIHGNRGPKLFILEQAVICLLILYQDLIISFSLIAEVGGSSIAHYLLFATQHHHEWSRHFLLNFFVEVYYGLLMHIQVVNTEVGTLVKRVLSPLLKPWGDIT
jgi:hypothetical protein